MYKLGDQAWLQDQRLGKLFTAIEKAAGKVRVAGGAVRNGLWGLPVKDIDAATTLRPEAIVECCQADGFVVYPTGIEHGTVTVVVDELSVEVTTLRADVQTDGRHARVEFTSNWMTDAQRRDFTINALYCDLSGRVYDETGIGLEDIEAGRIRFVGKPEHRIREDYLRILRYFRFSAQYGKQVFDTEAVSACARLRAGLKDLSAERIQGELLKTLTAPGAVPVIETMLKEEILQQLIEVDGSFDHLVRIVEAEKQFGIDPDAISRLAMLTSNASHLRLSKSQIQRFEALKTNFDISPENTDLAKRQLLYDLGEVAYLDAVVLAWVKSMNTDVREGWKRLFALPDNWSAPVFPLTGSDLLALGFLPGRRLGEALKKLEQQWVNGGFREEKIQLLNLAEKLKNK